jgi:glycosyltransferase involved in cell wall biosynthesis
MTGGSSRLVADLIEHLGHRYDQEIITSYLPDPPHYTGVAIHELRSATDIFRHLEEVRPELVHVHYWEECDREWYDMVFRAAVSQGCRIVENVNTPVEPYFSGKIDRYVYVSNYVRQRYGRCEGKELTVYPGSNFSLFNRSGEATIPDNCIGMVYRLETDKLNETSIDVFIKVAKLRPDTRVLIVGGGTYLEPYRNAARAAGVLDCFEFTGYVSYDKLPTYYERMSIFVAPVWKESFGQVSPFAMHMGIPVVGYDVGGLPEIIGNDSLLAPVGDSDRLADIIISLLNDREKRLAIGTANKERAKASFSVEAMVDAYADLYRQLLRSEA